jgi:phosphatidylinositol phospholipase C delta
MKYFYCRYLFNSQIAGAANPEAYTRVLLMGGRVVDLDCYDGAENEGPIVKHGFSLVKSCTFESIIRCMEPNLFKVSP